VRTKRKEGQLTFVKSGKVPIFSDRAGAVGDRGEAEEVEGYVLNSRHILRFEPGKRDGGTKVVVAVMVDGKSFEIADPRDFSALDEVGRSAIGKDYIRCLGAINLFVLDYAVLTFCPSGLGSRYQYPYRKMSWFGVIPHTESPKTAIWVSWPGT
jgi:hypothetical protein